MNWARAAEPAPGQLAMECADLRDLIVTAYGENVRDPSLLTPRFIGGRDQSPGTSFADNTDRPSIFMVIQQQLGLKLESAKGPVTAIVVNAIERPTEN